MTRGVVGRLVGGSYIRDTTAKLMSENNPGIWPDPGSFRGVPCLNIWHVDHYHNSHIRGKINSLPARIKHRQAATPGETFHNTEMAISAKRKLCIKGFLILYTAAFLIVRNQVLHFS